MGRPWWSSIQVSKLSRLCRCLVFSFSSAGNVDASSFTVWKIENVQNDKNIGKKGYQHFYDSIAQALEELDSLGAVVTISAGNDGQHDPPGLTDAYIPNILAAQPNSPLIIVGAVNSQGQLARISCPGSARIPINCYAMGKGIKVVDLSVEEVTEQDGTTFSVAIVVSTGSQLLHSLHVRHTHQST